MTLDMLPLETKATITQFYKLDPILKIRLMEMGLTVGTEIQISFFSPLGGTLAIECRDGLIALRFSDAKEIEVQT